jgi:hypothetical protein
MNKKINFNINDKVRVKNITENPVGTIIDIHLRHPEAGSLNNYYNDEACWIRLENGTLLKDVLPDEIILI